MKVAVIQLNAAKDKAKNIKNAQRLVFKAIKAKAAFIVLPEVFSFRGPLSNAGDVQEISESIPGESTRPLLALAKKHKVFILAGSVYERIRGVAKACNTSVLIGPRGEIVAKYRKKNLFNARVGPKVIRESSIFCEGKKLATAKVNGFQIGMSVCYDLRFPGLYQSYARKGVQVLCIPSSFTYQTGQAHWESLLRARAIENFCYVLAPNQTGKNGQGVLSYGNSMIVDPWGRILKRGTFNKEEILFAQLKKQSIKEAKQVFGRK